MGAFIIDKNAPIVVELTPRGGLKQVSLGTEDILEKSSKALDSSMNTIHNMAMRVNSMIEVLAVKPDQVEVEFGLKFDAEMGAMIAKAGMEASINVKLTWEHK
ncbi:MAG: CU044_2847 family protein [Candidatus Methanoperedens sp.]